MEESREPWLCQELPGHLILPFLFNFCVLIRVEFCKYRQHLQNLTDLRGLLPKTALCSVLHFSPCRGTTSFS